MRTPRDPQANADILALDPDFGAMAIRIGTETFSQEGLTPLDCALLCLANDVCQHLLTPVWLAFSVTCPDGPGQWGHTWAGERGALTSRPHAGMALVLEALVRLKELYPQFNQQEQALALAPAEAFPVFESASRETLSYQHAFKQSTNTR